MRLSTNKKESEHWLSSWFYNSLSNYVPSSVLSASAYLSGELSQFIHDIPKPINYSDPAYWDAYFADSWQIFLDELNTLSKEEIADRLEQMQTLIGPGRLSPLVYQAGIEDLCEDFLDHEVIEQANEQLAILKSRLYEHSEMTLRCCYTDLKSIILEALKVKQPSLASREIRTYGNWLRLPIYQEVLLSIQRWIDRQYPEKTVVSQHYQAEWKAMLNACYYQAREMDSEPPINREEEKSCENKQALASYGFLECMTLLLMGSHCVNSSNLIQYGLSSFFAARSSVNNSFYKNPLAMVTTTTLLSTISAQSVQMPFSSSPAMSDKISSPVFTALLNEKVFYIYLKELSVNNKTIQDVYYEILYKNLTISNESRPVYESAVNRKIIGSSAIAKCPDGTVIIACQEDEGIARFRRINGQTGEPFSASQILPSAIGYISKNPEPVVTCSIENDSVIITRQINQYSLQERLLLTRFDRNNKINFQFTQVDQPIDYPFNCSAAKSESPSYSFTIAPQKQDNGWVAAWEGIKSNKNKTQTEYYVFGASYYGPSLYSRSFTVNEESCNMDSLPSVAVIDNIGSVWTWHSYSVTSGIESIVTRISDSVGNMLTSQITISGNSKQVFGQMPAAISGCGTTPQLVILWLGSNSTDLHPSVFKGQTLKFENNKLTPLLGNDGKSISTAKINTQNNLSVTQIDSDTLLISWLDSEMKLIQSYFDCELNPTSYEAADADSCEQLGYCEDELHVSNNIEGYQSVASGCTRSDDSFFFTFQSWNQHQDILASIYSSSGEIVKSDFSLLQEGFSEEQISSDKFLSKQATTEFSDKSVAVVWWQLSKANMSKYEIISAAYNGANFSYGMLGVYDENGSIKIPFKPFAGVTYGLISAPVICTLENNRFAIGAEFITNSSLPVLFMTEVIECSVDVNTCSRLNLNENIKQGLYDSFYSIYHATLNRATPSIASIQDGKAFVLTGNSLDYSGDGYWYNVFQASFNARGDIVVNTTTVNKPIYMFNRIIPQPNVAANAAGYIIAYLNYLEGYVSSKYETSWWVEARQYDFSGKAVTSQVTISKKYSNWISEPTCIMSGDNTDCFWSDSDTSYYGVLSQAIDSRASDLNKTGNGRVNVYENSMQKHSSCFPIDRNTYVTLHSSAIQGGIIAIKRNSESGNIPFDEPIVTTGTTGGDTTSSDVSYGSGDDLSKGLTAGIVIATMAAAISIIFLGFYVYTCCTM